MSLTVPLILEEDCERGGKNYRNVNENDSETEGGIEDDFAYRNNVLNASKSIRLGFIRKVYGLLSMQLFLTVIIASICMFTPVIKDFVHTNDWTMIVALISSIVLLIALHVKRRETPTNLILLAAFTVVQAYSVGVILTYYSQAVVLQALLLTLSVLIGLTLFTFQTKRDFSAVHSGLFAGLLILIIGGFLQIFFHSTIFEIAFSLGGALLFCLFIVYDTQLMMNTLSAEEYVLATINLYMDIINLFLYILRILQAVNRQ